MTEDPESNETKTEDKRTKGPLPAVPESWMLKYMFWITILCAVIGWQLVTWYLGILAAMVAFFALVELGLRQVHNRISLETDRLDQEGRENDVEQYLRSCLTHYPKNQVIQRMLDNELELRKIASETETPAEISELRVTESSAVKAGLAAQYTLAEQDDSHAEHADQASPVEQSYQASPVEQSYQASHDEHASPAAPAGADQPADSGTEDPMDLTPAAPVVSGLAIAACVLSLLVFIPVVGVVPAVALLVIGLLLMLRKKLPMDRRVGETVLSFVMIAFITAGVMIALGRSSSADVELNVQPGEIPWNVKAVSFLVLIVSIVLHEASHAMAGWWSGDTTAKEAGRLTINPIPHIDLFGSVILPAIMIIMPGGLVFGWAKPVPFNPKRFRRRRAGSFAVSVSGVCVHLVLAFLSANLLVLMAVLLRAFYPEMTSSGFCAIFRSTRFQGIPFPEIFALLAETLKAGILINMLLFNLNLLPIPPLDGFQALISFLPSRWTGKLAALNLVGFSAIIILFMLNLISYLLIPGVAVASILLVIAGQASGLP